MILEFIIFTATEIFLPIKKSKRHPQRYVAEKGYNAINVLCVLQKSSESKPKQNKETPCRHHRKLPHVKSAPLNHAHV